MADSRYRIVASTADGRSATAFYQPPFSDEEMDDYVRAIGLVRRQRSAVTDRAAILKEIGSKLFASVVDQPEVSGVVLAAQAAAASRDHGLQITLRLSGAPELMRFPWELLYKQPRFLAQSERTPVVRSLDIGTTRRVREVRFPLRILGIISSPTGYPELDTARERRNLEQALAPLVSAGLVDISWLSHATLGELGRRVSQPDEIHVIHYIGHGAYDLATESGTLVLETEQGRPRDVSGEEFAEMLQDESSLRLVVLNSCEGARTSRVDPFSGVATALLHIDIPAVVAMQFEISDEAAIAFSGTLYSALTSGSSIAAAVAPARRSIIGAERRTEFATPVLYLRDGEARLFNFHDPYPEEEHQQAPQHAHTIATDTVGGTSEVREADRDSDAAVGKRPGVARESSAQIGVDRAPHEDSPTPGEPKGATGPSHPLREPVRWSAAIEYEIFSGLKHRVLIRLHGREHHVIEYRVGAWKVEVTVDGEAPRLPLGHVDRITLTDGGTQVRCAITTAMGGSGWPWNCTRVDSITADDQEVPLSHGNIKKS